VLLQPPRVVELCVSPANASAISAGRKLERLHRLHIEGPSDLLEGFFDEYTTMATPDERKTIREIAVAATVPKFGAFTQMLSKVFTARGSNQYFEFSTPQAQQDFEEWVAEQKIQQRLQDKFEKVSFTGFQGGFLVDLPGEPNAPDELPLPYWDYIPSGLIHDALVEGNKYEYVIIRQTELVNGQPSEYFVCFDDVAAHQVVRGEGGNLAYSEDRTVAHNLGYVPFFAPSLFAASQSSDVTRTSLLHKALPIAKVYLRDYNVHELDKTFHGFRKFWSFGVTCNHQRSVKLEGNCVGDAQYATLACTTGYFNYPDGHSEVCDRCRGEGKVVPVGPDKTYILEIPDSATSIDLRPPAGYIEPDIATAAEQALELQRKARELEEAALGKEGVLNRDGTVETATGKQIDLQPVFDRCTTYGKSWKWVLQNVLDTLARLRYSGEFKQSAINVGKKYQIETVDELKARYKLAKEAGYPDSVLFGLLEDIVYTEYADDPMELEYNRIKLYLEPVPTRSTSEVQQWLFQRAEDAELQALFTRKRNLNDYVARFERENGPLVQFGVRQPFATRIDTILATFTLYDNERKQVPA
jgi:hypothetical protein